MKSFKIHNIDENKAHFVKKLKNLTRAEKKRIIDHLKKYPALEDDIDWGNKDLTITDFQVMLHSRSKTKVKKDVKSKGISGLKKGVDYIDVSYMFDYYNAYMPLNYEASKYIASKYIGNCTGQWCTAENNDQWWISYTIKHNFSFIYIISYDKEEKFAIALNKKLSKIDIFDKTDRNIEKIPYDNIYNIIKRNKKNLIKNTKKVDRGYGDIPYWFEISNTLSAEFEIVGNKFIWKDGIWKFGDWFGSKWEKGLWKRGTWFEGTWVKGTWVKGTWYRGIWKDGTWEGGKWERGLWEKGIWHIGTWWNGKWKDGLWEGGIWHKGTWEKGTWIKGTWRNGLWEKGIWYNGTWHKGIWEDGTWEKGTWLSGTWLGGKWLGGYDKDGYLHKAGDSPDKWDKE